MPTAECTYISNIKWISNETFFHRRPCRCGCCYFAKKIIQFSLLLRPIHCDRMVAHTPPDTHTHSHSNAKHFCHFQFECIPYDAVRGAPGIRPGLTWIWSRYWRSEFHSSQASSVAQQSTTDDDGSQMIRRIFCPDVEHGAACVNRWQHSDRIIRLDGAYLHILLLALLLLYVVVAAYCKWDMFAIRFRNTHRMDMQLIRMLSDEIDWKLKARIRIPTLCRITRTLITALSHSLNAE